MQLDLLTQTSCACVFHRTQSCQDNLDAHERENRMPPTLRRRSLQRMVSDVVIWSMNHQSSLPSATRTKALGAQ
jgi:hypothetical protein